MSKSTSFKKLFLFDSRSFEKCCINYRTHSIDVSVEKKRADDEPLAGWALVVVGRADCLDSVAQLA